MEEARSRAAADATALRRARIFLAAVLLPAGLHLLLGERPWGDGSVAAGIEADGALSTSDYVHTWSYWAACWTFLSASSLLLTARLWTRCIEPAAADRPSLTLPERRAMSRWLWGAIAGAIVMHAYLGLPRLSHSFWGDEAYSVRTAIAGVPAWKGDHWRDPKLKWRETFHYYKKPNNHVPFSILARLSNRAWTAIADPPERLRNEVPVRLPAFLAGLLAIASAAFFVHRLGYSAAAAATAWLLALHPWMLRYSTEARGYSLLLALLPALWLATLRVLREGNWSAWILFGVCQWLVLWTYPAAFLTLAVTNLVLLGLLFRGRREQPAKLREQLSRYAVTLVVSATAFLQLMAPNLAQFWGYVQTKQLGEMSVALARDLSAHLVFGTPWGHEGPGPSLVDLHDLATAHPMLVPWGMGLILALALAGILRLLRGGDVRVGIAAALVLPLPLTWMQAALQGNVLYVWYLIFALPSLVALAAIGSTWATAAIARPGPRAAATAGVAVGLLVGFAVATGPTRAALREVPIQPLRDSVEVTRPSLDPSDPRNETILTATIYEGSQYYDPRCIDVEDPPHLRSLMRRADADRVPFFVVYGRERLVRKRRPELWDIVHRESLFEHVATQEGFFDHFSRYVYRYRAGSVASAGPE